jgi:hypothetical protein
MSQAAAAAAVPGHLEPRLLVLQLLLHGHACACWELHLHRLQLQHLLHLLLLVLLLGALLLLAACCWGQQLL